MIRIKGGRVIDPANGIDREMDVYIEGGEIVSAQAAKTAAKIRVIEAKGLLVVPGLIDLHVHLREPGQEYKETVATGCAAAAAGGFTSLVSMPNTQPVCDHAAVVEYIFKQAQGANGVSVFPMGAISKKLEGEELAEMGDMVRAGARAFTDDGKGLMNAAVMRAAFEYARNFGVPVAAHCEERRLAELGQMHEGEVSTRLGLQGIPAAAESVMVARDIQLCELTGSRYHVQHISTKESVELVRQAKRKGLSVTCEVTPHHLALTDQAVIGYDTNYKMNPPLRSEEHVRALRRGLKDGTIDCIASDHAPHVETDKKVEFDQASNGVIGLETALPIALDLVREGVLELPELIAKFTVNPAKILGLEKGTLSLGADADVTVIDPELVWTYSEDQVRSKSRNSPWLNAKLMGRAVVTIAKGKVIHEVE